jgi:hypothetical protein
MMRRYGPGGGGGRAADSGDAAPGLGLVCADAARSVVYIPLSVRIRLCPELPCMLLTE